MEKVLDEILAALHRQIGLHRQLLEATRAEKEALTELRTSVGPVVTSTAV